MPRKKISKKREFSLADMPTFTYKNRKGIRIYDPLEDLRNPQLVAKALWECILVNDMKELKQILRWHLEAINKDKFAKEAGIPKRTLFRMLTPEGNPTLDTFSKIIHHLCA